MDPSEYYKFLVLVVCLFLSSLFSASETALMSLSEIRVRQMLDKEVKGIKRVNKLLSDPNRLLSSILIGNNLTNIAGSSLMTSIAIDLFGNTGVGIATGIMTLLILIFAEITPKSLAAQNAEKLSLSLSRFVYINMILVTPLSYLLSKTTNTMIKILGGNQDSKRPFMTHEELKTIVSVSYKEGVIEDEEKEMIDNVFNFRSSYVGDIMTRRTDIITLDASLSYEQIIKKMGDKQYSRIPVCEDSRDNIIGILFLKDLMFLSSEEEANFDIADYLREPYFTFKYKPLKDLFQEMKVNRIHMAIVIDEYGGTSGVVTMEDLVEEIVGDIEDEYDEVNKDIIVVRENEYIVSGTLKIEEVKDLLKIDLESDDFDTIAGFVIGLIDRIPKLKEVVRYENLKFVIEKLDKNRVDKIRIIKTIDSLDKDNNKAKHLGTNY